MNSLFCLNFFPNNWGVCSTPHALSPNALSPHTLSPHALIPHTLSTDGLSEKLWIKFGLLDVV